MKVGILFNCQHRMLADVLRLTRPDIDVLDLDLGSLREDPAAHDAGVAALAACDVVLTLHLDSKWGSLATEEISKSMQRMVILPGFGFAGFHPDTVYIPTADGFLGGLTHHYHSRIAVAGFLAGLSARATTDLYNALVMGRAGYFTAFDQERLMICQLFDRFGIDLDPLFDRWMGRGCFMHSINHPKAWCYTDVALALLRYAGFIGRDVTVDSALVNDDLQYHPTHPVLPQLARRLGVPAEHRFKPSRPHEDYAVNLDDFVKLEFERFAEVPRAALEATPGVATLRAVLG